MMMMRKKFFLVRNPKNLKQTSLLKKKVLDSRGMVHHIVSDVHMCAFVKNFKT